MIFLVLTISFNLLATGNLQEPNNADGFKLPQQNLGDASPVLGKSWPVQTIQTVQGNFFGQAVRNINAKPCSGRRNLHSSDEQWIPTFTSKIIKPIANFDKSYLDPQAIKEENYKPLVTPIVEQKYPIAILNDDQNNLYKPRISLSFDDLTKDKIEYATEVQDKLASEERSGIEPTDFNEGALSLVNNDEEIVEKSNEDDKISENLENVELKSNLEEKEPGSESKVETVRFPEECMNTKNKVLAENVIGHSRRSMSKFGKETELNNIAGINDKAANELNNNLSNNRNNLEKQINDDNKNLLTPKGNTNKNVINMRKATPPKFITNGKMPLHDSYNELLEPTKGSGVSELSESRIMLMDSRLCYACSTANNPTCWAPDRKTTVKYCHKGHEACVTKTYQTGNKLTLVRDCGKSCEDIDIPGFVPKYKSCSICHSDLCNSAYMINNNKVIFAFLLITVIKYYY